MAVNKEYLDFVLDQLNIFGGVAHKKMFGGAGLFRDGHMFALIAGDELYFKVDDLNRQDYLELGLTPFKPFAHKNFVMPYYPVPIEIIEDAHEFANWAAKSFGAALRQKK